MIGKTVSHYKIIDKLGEGGMGIVYLAEDKKLKRQVAIKFLPNHIAHNCEERERFEIEAQATAALNHPNIATIHAIEHNGDDIYIVLEYIEGRELRDEVRSWNLDIGNINEIAVQIAEGLQAAHEKSIIHRDIKSSNIMITTKGRAKIMDFGLAKIRGSAQITREHSTLGTAAYMSPEQSIGEEVDHRTDIWSFGVVLYEMFTGQLPFRGDYESAVIYSIRNDDPEPVSKIRDDISLKLTQIIEKTLEKKPDSRYQKMEDLIADLKTWKESPVSREATVEEKTTLSIVVLPFANLSADADNEYFSDGLTEEIIADLSKVGALSVISRTSAMQLKGTNKDLRTIGRELDVRYVLEGSVRKADNSLRITAQLIDAHTDMHLWAEKYNGTMDDVFDLQERVSRQIVNMLNVTLTSDEDRRLSDHPIADVRAFELYLQARQELRRIGTEPIERASNLLAQAIEIEGETPPLRSMRAWSKVTVVRSGLNRDLQPLKEAEAEGQTLLELAPDAPYGYALLGYIEYERGNQPQAVKHFLSALEREPNDSDTLFYLGISYMSSDQMDEAANMSKKLIACDPLNPFAWILSGGRSWFIGQPEDALKSLRRNLKIDPQNLIVQWSIGYTYATLGEFSKAAKYVTYMRENAPDVPYTRQLQALVDALNGNNKRALESLATVEVAALDAHNKFHLSESFAMAGDIDRALNIVEQAIDEGFYPYSFIAEHCPFMAPLRKTSKWAAILAKVQHRVELFELKIGPIHMNV